MAFLTPFFLVGLGAIAIPVLIHLIQREKKRVIEFPSLMFVRRIPYQSVRRRRISLRPGDRGWAPAWSGPTGTVPIQPASPSRQ